MKMCLISGYWISVHRFKSCTMKASEWLQLVRRDFGMLDKLNESSTKIPWKVDYLFTAGVLKMKMCLISGYWISVHRFKSCTMKASVWLQLVRFDFGMLDKLNESSTKIPWKVDYLFTAGVLKMKMCLISGYWISTFLAQWKHRNDFSWFAVTSVCWICWMKVTKIPWKVDYLFTAEKWRCAS